MKKLLPLFRIVIVLLIVISSNASAAVVADFTSDISSGCSPLTVKFTDASTGSPTSWNWNFGNGNTSGLKNPSAVYNTPGVYSVSLTVSDISSTSTKVKTITVYANPVAGFTFTPTSPCAGKPVSFADKSTLGGGAISTWNWDFGDGVVKTTSTGTTSHTYASGTFPVSLIVTDVNGCTGSVVATVKVNPAPVASFTATPRSKCTPPLTVNFTNTSTVTGSATYSWTFGDGSTSTSSSPSHAYNLSGTYNVKLVVTQGGCKDSIVKNNYIVVKKIVADFSVNTQTVCAGKSISFSDQSLPLSSTRTWFFGDGGTSSTANPNHTYNTPGVYSVTLIARDASSCSDTIIKNSHITVLANPVATFTANATAGCSVPFAVGFTDNSANAAAWNWKFGDGDTSSSQNPVHSYSLTGTFSVTLTVTSASGCTSTMVRNSFIFISLPVVNFTATPLKGCIPLPVNFSSTSTSAAVPIASYEWDFGDGSTATTATSTTSHTYVAQGVYDVKLKIITSSGCTDSLTKIAYVKAGTKPIADFSESPDTICFGLSVDFVDLTNIADEWLWSFGDGGSSSAQNPSHVYTDTGLFKVRLIAFNNGCPDTLEKDDLILVKPPKPNFSYQLSCTDYYIVDFTNTSAAADSITWDFGDGTFDFTNNNAPTHTYLTRGSKTVTLTAFNKTSGCSFFMSKTFTIAEPLANFIPSPSPARGCVPLYVGFTSTSQDANKYLWNFGNGGTSSLSSPVATYLSKGLYDVTLTITDVNGCTNTKSIDDLVNAYAITLANFSATPPVGCAPLTVTFMDSTVSDSVVAKWTWTWGDGTTNTVSSPTTTHIYNIRGTYSVTLSVRDTNGCVATAVRSNYIKPTKPYPKLAVDTFNCRNEIITFSASGSTGAGLASYEWDFGDGTADTTTTATTTHAYTSDNIYTVTLKVTDTNGCDSTISKNIRVLQPTPGFIDSTISYGCGTKIVQFTDTSSGFVNSWTWDFGNGASSTLQNPSYTYTSPGVYTVKLIVKNIGGCVDSITKTNVITVPGPVGSFSFFPSSGCVPLTVTFNATSGNSDYFTWDFGDGTVLAQSAFSTIQHTYTDSILALPILLLGDTLPNGLPCELPGTNLTGTILATYLLDVDVDPSSPILIKEEELIPLVTNITGAFSNSLVYEWSPSAGLSCTDCGNPLLSSIDADTVEYIVKVTDVGAGGCIGWDTVMVVFVPCVPEALVPNVFSPNDDGVNDIFKINGVCVKSDYHLTIFDRWGIQMFSSNLRRNTWDGRTTSGQPAPEGVYYYVVMVDGEVSKGFVHLLR